MKNKEKYAVEIEEFLVSTMAMKDGEIVGCEALDCGKCDFFKMTDGRTQCYDKTRAWLNSEYVEPKPKLTKRERYFIDCIVTDFHLVKQVDGSVALFVGGLILELDEGLFPFVTKMTSKKELLQMEVEE